jgi:hypothetical protein
MEWMSLMLGSAAVCAKQGFVETAMAFINPILLADRTEALRRRGFSDHQ